jgi:hypothetical protein
MTYTTMDNFLLQIVQISITVHPIHFNFYTNSGKCIDTTMIESTATSTAI